MKKVALHNLGCKVNAYETQAMEELLAAHGYTIVPFAPGADIYIINTCSVTNIADRKSRQMLHKARKLNPAALVVAAGCYVETNGGPVDPAIDIVIGNNKKADIIAILAEYERERPALLEERLDINRTHEYEDFQLTTMAEHVRAFVKIQDGCNQFCSYCIIPYARGRVRSRSPEAILAEVTHLTAKGYQEIVLTGIHISSYGQDNGADLLRLTRRLHDLPGLARIRFGSLEPRIMTEEFVRALAALPKICPHFHLSLQSGCDATLQRMNRRYTTAEYRQVCERLRTHFARPALTTDVIVGFPGESPAEFDESRQFIDSLDFYETHVFKFSPRAGTRAATMPAPVPESEKTRRSRELLALSRRKQARFEAGVVGTCQEVLVEEAVTRPDGCYQVGRTKEYIKLGLKTEKNLVNRLVHLDVNSSLQIIH